MTVALVIGGGTLALNLLVAVRAIWAFRITDRMFVAALHGQSIDDRRWQAYLVHSDALLVRFWIWRRSAVERFLDRRL